MTRKNNAKENVEMLRHQGVNDITNQEIPTMIKHLNPENNHIIRMNELTIKERCDATLLIDTTVETLIHWLN